MTAQRPDLRQAVRMAGTVVFGLVIALSAVVVVAKLLDSDEPGTRSFFAEHRRDLDRVAEMVSTGGLVSPPGEEYYGPALPKELRYLSDTQRVSIVDLGTFFIPRWTGIPDDAGGYWHSATSPEGRDMYGMGCVAPIDLGGSWWACGMKA